MYCTTRIGAIMIRKGFSLLEVLLATAIAASISALLIGLWNQMVQSQVRVERFTDIYSRAALLNAQMQRDISGAFIPLDELKETGTGQKEQTKKIENVFVGDSNLQQLTFITNNPMPVYWSDRVGKPQPLIARVVYTLIPEKKHTNSFVLMRQEGNELELQPYTQENSKIRSYQLATGIKSVTVEYAAMVAKQKSVDEKTVQQKEPEFERVTKTAWKSSGQQDQAEQEQKLPLIPHWVIMKIELWDDATFTRSTTCTYTFNILPSLDATIKPVPKAQAKPAASQPRQRTLTERIRQPQAQVRRRRPSATVARRTTTNRTHREEYLTRNVRTTPRVPRVRG
jgi:prepilin-type N-terminal cleavage/methylation domain-containing protein